MSLLLSYSFFFFLFYSFVVIMFYAVYIHLKDLYIIIFCCYLFSSFISHYCVAVSIIVDCFDHLQEQVIHYYQILYAIYIYFRFKSILIFDKDSCNYSTIKLIKIIRSSFSLEIVKFTYKISLTIASVGKLSEVVEITAELF